MEQKLFQEIKNTMHKKDKFLSYLTFAGMTI